MRTNIPAHLATRVFADAVIRTVQDAVPRENAGSSSPSVGSAASPENGKVEGAKAPGLREKDGPAVPSHRLQATDHRMEHLCVAFPRVTGLNRQRGFGTAAGQLVGSWRSPDSRMSQVMPDPVARIFKTYLIPFVNQD